MNDPSPAASPARPSIGPVLLTFALFAGAIWLLPPWPATSPPLGAILASIAAIACSCALASSLASKPSVPALAGVLSITSTGLSIRVVNACLLPVDSVSLVATSAVTVLFALSLSSLHLDRPASLHPDCLAAASRAQMLRTALAALSCAVPLASCAFLPDGASSAFAVLSTSCLAVTTLLWVAMTPRIPRIAPWEVSETGMPPSRARKQGLRLLAGIVVVAPAAWLASSAASSEPHGRAALASAAIVPSAIVLAAALFTLLVVLADPLLAALLSLVPALAATAGLATVSLASPGGDLPAIVFAGALACGVAQGLLMTLSTPGRDQVASSVVASRLVRASVASAIGAFCAALLSPTESRPPLLGLSLSLSLAALVFDFATAPALVRLLAPDGSPADSMISVGSSEHASRFSKRFRHLPPWVRFAALAKVRFDPMFPAVAAALPIQGCALDLGAGFGVVAAWLTSARPALRLTCIEVSSPRAAIARHVAGPLARVLAGDVLDLTSDCPPDWARSRYDAVLLLDVIHHLDNADHLLRAIPRLLHPNGVLVLRTAVAIDDDPSRETLSQRWERLVVRARGQRVRRYLRAQEVTEMLSRAGFGNISLNRPHDGRPETLFVAKR